MPSRGSQKNEKDRRPKCIVSVPRSQSIDIFFGQPKAQTNIYIGEGLGERGRAYIEALMKS